MRGGQVLLACFFVAAFAVSATAGRPRSLLEDGSTATTSFDLPLPFAEDAPAMPNVDEALTEAAPEVAEAPTEGLTSKGKGKDGKKLDVHLKVEKPDVKGKLTEAKTEVKEKAAAAKAEVEKKLAAAKEKLPKKEKAEKKEEKTIVDPKAIKTELAHQVDPMTADQEPLMATDPGQSVAPSAQQLEDSVSEMARHASDSLGDLKKKISAHLGDIDKKLAGDLKDKIKAGTEKAKEKLETKEAEINCAKFGKDCPPTPPPEPESPPPPVPSPPPPSPSPPPPTPVFSPPPPSKEMLEKLDKLAKLELLADKKLAAFGPSAENLVDTLHKVKDDARKRRDIAFDTARNYTLAMARLAAQQAIDTQRALADSASTTTQTIRQSQQQLASDTRTIRDGLAAGAQPSDEALTLPDPATAVDPATAATAVLPGASSALSSAGAALSSALPSPDGNAALAAATDVASQGLPAGALPSADAVVTGALVGSVAGGLTSADMSAALINAQAALQNVQTALRADAGSLQNIAAAAGPAAAALPALPTGISGTASASASMPSVTQIIQSQQGAAQGLLPNVTAIVQNAPGASSIANAQNALTGANPMAAAAVQGVGQTLQNAGNDVAAGIQNAQVSQTTGPGALPQGLNTGLAAQGSALAQTIQQAQQALLNAQATLQSTLMQAANQPAQLLTNQINGFGAQLATAVQGMQSQMPLTGGLTAGITPGMNSVTSTIAGSMSGVDLPTAGASIPATNWDMSSTVVYSNNAPSLAPGPTHAASTEAVSCCDAPTDSTCSAFMETFHIRLAPAADRWAQEYFCARDSNNKGRLTPVSSAFASCLSLTSPDVRECVADAECQLPAPLGHGPGYFCAEMPCCANVNTLLSQLPEGVAGNTTIRAQATSGPRKICRPDAAAFGNAGVCSARTSASTIDTPSGMSLTFKDSTTNEPLFNATTLAVQAGLAALPRVYASVDLAAQDFAAGMDPDGYAKLRNVLADQAQAAVTSLPNISSILKLRSQLDSSIVDFAYSLAGQPPKAAAAASPDSAPGAAMAPARDVSAAKLPVGAPVLAPAQASTSSPLTASVPAPSALTPAPSKKGKGHKKSKPVVDVSAPAPAKSASAPAAAGDIVSAGVSMTGLGGASNFTLGLGPDGDFTMTQMMAAAGDAAPVPKSAEVAGAPTISAQAPSTPTTVLASDRNYIGQSPPDLYAALGPPAPTSGTIPGIVHTLLPGTVNWVNTTNTVATTVLQPAQNFVNGTAVNSAIQATADTIIDNTVGNGPYRVGPLDGAAIFGSEPSVSSAAGAPPAQTAGVPWNPPPISFDPPPTPTIGTVTPAMIAAERAPPAPAGSALEAILQALGPQQTLGQLPPTSQVVNTTATAILG